LKTISAPTGIPARAVSGRLFLRAGQAPGLHRVDSACLLCFTLLGLPGARDFALGWCSPN